MSGGVERLMYEVSQLFLMPVLLLIALVFAYAFAALGACLWQARLRRRQHPSGFELTRLRQGTPAPSLSVLEAHALQRLERVRLATRITPMLGLVATMIPMGPALKSLAEGQLAQVSQHLMVAFSAVILALIASAITYGVAQVRRRWYAAELLALQEGGAP